MVGLAEAQKCKPAHRACCLCAWHHPAGCAGHALLCRPLTYAWDFTAAASQLPALRQLALDATSSSSPRLVIPPALAGSLSQGAYTVQMNVTNWLGMTSEQKRRAGCRAGAAIPLPHVLKLLPLASKAEVQARPPLHRNVLPHLQPPSGKVSLSFSKEAAALPLVTIVGGPQQTFSLGAGINIQTQIDVLSVCPGKTVTYTWAETSGLLPAGSFAASRPDLTVKVRGGAAGRSGGV